MDHGTATGPEKRSSVPHVPGPQGLFSALMTKVRFGRNGLFRPYLTIHC